VGIKKALNKESKKFFTFDEINEELAKPIPVNWEKLCKQLQEALAREMCETQDLEAERDKLLMEMIELKGVIKYLEKQLIITFERTYGNHTV
jgi:hypothetical protein